MTWQDHQTSVTYGHVFAHVETSVGRSLLRHQHGPPVPEFAQSRCALQDWSSYPKHTSLEKEREEGSDRGGWTYRWFVSQEWVNVSAVPSELELHQLHCQRIFSCNLQTWNNRTETKTVSFAFSVTIMQFNTFFFLEPDPFRQHENSFADMLNLLKLSKLPHRTSLSP